MPDTSSYLRYLPPVLWESEPDPPAFSLGSMLLIFEKLLTGLNDDVTIARGDQVYQSLEEEIATIYQLFDPWTTPPAFLSWLASWLGLELPDSWDEYQSRKAISEISQIYRGRGLKDALNRYLALYTIIQTRPRITIDDGSKLLFAQPRPGHFASLYSLVSQGDFAPGNPVTYTGLVRPWAIAAAPDGSLFVGDAGTLPNAPTKINSMVWRIDSSGAYTFAATSPNTSPIQQPLNPSGLNLISITGIAVRVLPTTTATTANWEVYVLDASGALYLLSPPFTTATLVTNVDQAGAVFPIALAVDNNNNLLVLDRGSGSGQVFTIQMPSPPYQTNSFPVPASSISKNPLNLALDPLSFAVQPDGSLLVGASRWRSSPTDTNPPSVNAPANLIHVNRSNSQSWVESLLLPATNTPTASATVVRSIRGAAVLPPLPPNPLVAPTAIAQEDSNHILVLDAGLKPFRPDPNAPFLPDVAEQAILYRFDLSTTSPTITRASEISSMVYPTGMSLSHGTLFICDPGLPIMPANVTQPLYRLLPYQFAVIVHFCKQRLPQDRLAQTQVRGEIITNITRIINQEKPAHTFCQIITET